MRKVNLRMNEEYKFELIKQLSETNGNKKAIAIKLKCTMRTVNRLIKKYEQEGKAGFLHGNRGRKPSSTIQNSIKQSIIDLYTDDYSDTNFTHFCEIVNEELNYKISDTTLNRWLRDENIISPKAKRKTKKFMKKLLKAKLNITQSEKVKNEIKESIAMIDSKNAHPTRSRSKYMGEMIQMDASSFHWIPNEVWHLHLAVDDSTGTVVGAYFDTQETLNGYYNVFHRILTNFGIPAMFYTDRRTVFEYKRKNTAFDDDDTFTQFSYACHQLGVEIKTTSVAQAKGRVERLNQTFQSRLPVELRRAHIKDIDAANEFLNSYIKKFNEQFALHLNITQNVFETQPSIEKINTTLSVLSERKIDSGHSIKYKNKYYRTIQDNKIPAYFNKGSTALVIESFDKNLYANVLDRLFILEEIPQHNKHSLNFEVIKEDKKEKKQYIPPMSHPWKHASFNAYLAKQKHRPEYGANV
ncbi:MAG: ISNCY family transposase [Erysipelotrichaceae bacterium]